MLRILALLKNSHYLIQIGNHTSKSSQSNTIITVIILLLIMTCSLPLSSIAQDNYEIRKIKFSGNKTLSKANLLEHMSISETNFYKQKIQKKEPSLFSQEFIDADIERLKRYYQSEGFLNAEVRLDSLRLNDKKRRVNIYIHIKENDPVKTSNISISTNPPLLDTNTDSISSEILKDLKLNRESRFQDATLYNDVSQINNSFVNMGYVYAKTDFKLNLKTDSNKVDILYQVKPGSICQLSETSISGNRYIKEKVIRKQLEYKSGETYSSDKLDLTRKNLYNLQLFRIVSISPQTDRATGRNPIPVQIRIEEMPRLMTKFGVGYGTEDKFRAFADITYRGLFGGTSRLNLYVKHSALIPYYVGLAWIEPQFFFKKLGVSVNPYIQREKEPGYTTNTIGLNIPTGYTFTDKIQTSLTYYIERVTQEIESDDAEIPNPEDNEFLYNKSGLSASIRLSDAEPVFSPEKGGIISLGAKLNGYIFGSDFNYTRLWLDVRQYFKMKDFVFALRGMIGGIHSSDDNQFIPVEDRFYSGGGNSNRGWSRAMLGPKRESGTPLGGKSILEMNFEVRHPLVWIIELAAFIDISNIWTPSYHYRFNDLAYSVGGGIRISTPIGPIRFDVGVPVWNEKKSPQFFLSVGQAF